MTEINASPNNDTKPPQTGGNQAEIVDEVTSFHPVNLSDDCGDLRENGENMQELLRNINEESSKLSEFLATENKLMIEICMSLAQVFKKLGLSFDIPSRDLPLQEKVKTVVLDKEGHLKLFYEKGEVHSAFLAEYSSEIVMAVLWVVMPELARAIALQRKKIDKRISLFETIKKELKNVAKTLVGASEENKKVQTGTQPNTSNGNSQSKLNGC